MKHHALFAAAGTAAALAVFPAAGLEATMTSAGFTGLGLTPDARLVGWGRVALAYDHQLPGAANPAGHNVVAGFGLFPNLEFSARVAANSPLQANCFVERCGGLRDLSASAKAAIGLDARNHFFIAAGATDVGGQATNFRSYYGVLTYLDDAIEISGGAANRISSATQATRAPLAGPFASAAWQPLPWLRGHIEYTDHNAWAGVRLFAPASWLPQGWSAHIGADARLTDTTLTQRSWFSAGLSIPLYKVPNGPSGRAPAPLPELADAQRPLPTYEARMPPTGMAMTPVPQATAPAPAPAPATAPANDPLRPTARASPPPPARAAAGPDLSTATLEALAERLRQQGLEDIWVGRMPDRSVAVRVNNATYNWNAVDALGVALGAVSQALGETRTAYRLVLTQRQIPLVAVTGEADCLRQWIALATPACPAGELSTPGTTSPAALQAGAEWVVQRLQPSWKTLRVGLTPVLRTNIATEVGTLDYSAGIGANVSLPLWPGASADWRVTAELARSDDYAPGGVFYNRHIPNDTETLALTQSLALPLANWLARGDEVAVRNAGLAAASAQVAVGRFGYHFDGVNASLRWEPGEGRHRVTAAAGWMRNEDFGRFAGEPERATPLLLSYRYDVAATRTYIEATAGQFMFGDRGGMIGLRQWFGDVSVQLYYRRTNFASTGTRSTAGLEFTVPIGPRRDMNPSLFQVTGTPRFSHAVETTVGSRQNVVSSGYGVQPPVSGLDAVFNSDRASLLYFEDNIRRIRDAARW
jgi:hypothetical protein